MAILRTIVVDDSLAEVRKFVLECANIPDIQVAGMFASPLDALAFAESYTIDLALLDINMPEMNGFELAKRLREARQDILIVFITGYPELAADALRLKADYVIFKPYTRQDIVDVIDRARLLSRRQVKRVQVRTFGEFDVLVDDKPLHFRLAKAKELMALCIAMNGQDVSIHTIVDRLWDGNDMATTANTSYRMAIKNLGDTLAEADMGDIFTHKRGFCSIRRSEVDCDYFDLLDGKPGAELAFQGEFMTQYSWAEEYVYNLIERKEAITLRKQRMPF